jgi:hypothetical protein
METTSSLAHCLEILIGGKGVERFRFAFREYTGEKITMYWDLTKYCDKQEEGFSIWMTSDEAKIFLNGLMEG